MTAGLPERLLKKCFWAIPFLYGQKSTKGDGNMVKSGLVPIRHPEHLRPGIGPEMTLPVLVLEGKIRNWI